MGTIEAELGDWYIRYLSSLCEGSRRLGEGFIPRGCFGVYRVGCGYFRMLLNRKIWLVAGGSDVRPRAMLSGFTVCY